MVLQFRSKLFDIGNLHPCGIERIVDERCHNRLRRRTGRNRMFTDDIGIDNGVYTVVFRN